jgi:hypothetical protein
VRKAFRVASEWLSRNQLGKPDEPPWVFAECLPDPPPDYVGVTVR